jgi:hypothetical protein
MPPARGASRAAWFFDLAKAQSREGFFVMYSLSKSFAALAP